jgi:uronate dehydrogenase
MSPTNGTVVLTGAAGRIGMSLRAQLPDLGWTLRCLAGQPTEAPWPVIRDANLEGTYQLFEAARRHGVRRVVYASSNHAVGFTKVGDELAADTAPRPDTLYGVSKVFGEALGRYYVDRYDLQVACLRIGTFADQPPDLRALSTWLSPADCARLVDACLRSDALTYSLVWGISANTRRAWSLAEGYALGYFPADDAERFAGTLPDTQAYPSDAFVGGGFTSSGFGIDEVASRW